MAIGGRPDEVHRDERIKAAAGLSTKYVRGVKTVTDQDFEGLKDLFTEKELAELCAFVVFISASHQFGVLMNVGAD